MNPVRFLREEWSPWLVGLFALAVAILAIVLWARARERRGDWGPGLLGVPEAVGYAPADLGADAAATPVADARDRWLLGLAAPFVEQAGLLHDRWSLVPAPCDDAWRRRLTAIAAAWGVTRADRWKREVREAELGLGESQASPGWADPRPWQVARLAMLLRLGVAARHTAAPRARRRLERAAAPLRADYRDWLGYADAFVSGAELFQPGRTVELRADLRTLYAVGGPWHDVAWRAG